MTHIEQKAEIVAKIHRLRYILQTETNNPYKKQLAIQNIIDAAKGFNFSIEPKIKKEYSTLLDCSL